SNSFIRSLYAFLDAISPAKLRLSLAPLQELILQKAWRCRTLGIPVGLRFFQRPRLRANFAQGCTDRLDCKLSVCSIPSTYTIAQTLRHTYSPAAPIRPALPSTRAQVPYRPYRQSPSCSILSSVGMSLNCLAIPYT